MADVTVTAKDVRPLPGGNIHPKNLGAAANVGDAGYIDSSGNVQPVDADAALTSYGIGIIVSAPNGKTAGVTGDRVDLAMVGSIVTGYSGLTPGTLMYASTTAGRISDTRPAGASGDFAFIIGFAWDATSILVNPFADILTAL